MFRYIYGLYLAEQILNKNNKYKVLLICSDTYTKNITYKNKSCSTIFSDGASATVIKFKKNKKFIFIFFTDGSGSDNLILKNSGLNQKLNLQPELFMDGRQVLTFTMNNVPDLILKLLKKNNLKINKIDHFIFHQASKIVINNLIRILNIEPKKKFIKIFQNLVIPYHLQYQYVYMNCIRKKKLKREIKFYYVVLVLVYLLQQQ